MNGEMSLPRGPSLIYPGWKPFSFLLDCPCFTWLQSTHKALWKKSEPKWRPRPRKRPSSKSPVACGEPNPNERASWELGKKGESLGKSNKHAIEAKITFLLRRDCSSLDAIIAIYPWENGRYLPTIFSSSHHSIRNFCYLCTLIAWY